MSTIAGPTKGKVNPVPTVSTPSASEPIVYVNGKMVPKSQAAVNVFDHGLLYGDGIFEGIRVYRGRIFKLGQHLDRLWRCAEAIKLKIHISRDEMARICRECVAANAITEGYIRLLVTRGEGTLGLNPYLCPVPGIICIADQIRLYPVEMYEKGMKVIVAERPRIPPQCLDPRIKSLNYLNNVLAKVEALDVGLFEVIMLSTDGWVTEGSGDNIFIVKNGNVITPPAEVGVLEGITRKFVMDELCPALGVTCEERNFRIEEVYSAEEVFLTGSAAEIIAVTKVAARKSEGGKEYTISDGEGPLTKKLRQKFREVVTSDNVPED
ncbi:MAG: branched-chain-amino-acid transaminase [Phycisphaeraceae bacterium]|nr:branched-chain-amino-acid transaminase [Phycisphaeraceae bacterium]MCW5754364.1 branched-chain-amino-acid transaminase [Phycisphaeraceae bacterium]